MQGQEGRNVNMAEEYNVQAIMNDLRIKDEMDPDQHDGCYEIWHGHHHQESGSGAFPDKSEGLHLSHFLQLGIPVGRKDPD